MPEPLPEIAFDVFEQVEMTVVKVLACEPVKKSEKLLKFQLDDGTGAPGRFSPALQNITGRRS